jgi:hypothetical protein
MRPDDGRLSLWPAAVIGVIVVLALASITPVLRLNPVPPSDFVTLKSSAKGPDAALAAGYWKSAESVVQWKYDRTSTLPEQIPADFRLADNSGNGITVESQGARSAYWAKLREEWLKSDNWHTTYSFDLSWMMNNALALSRGLTNFVKDHM